MDDDYENYLKAECEHLYSLKSEPAEVQQAVDYMELLKKVQDLKYVLHILELSMTLIIQLRMESDHAKVSYNNLDFDIINNGYTQKEIAAVCTRWWTEELSVHLKMHFHLFLHLQNSNDVCT